MRTKTYILLLIMVGLFLYFSSLTNGFIGDDKDQIVNNPLVHSLENIPKFFTGSTYFNQQSDKLAGIFYRPFMMIFFTVIYSLFTTYPFYYHLFQLILFTINSILVFLLLKKFLNIPVAFFGALLFLIHPINSETALFIANIQDVLFFLFGITALLLIQSKKLSSENNAFIISFLLLCSLFSKESGMLFIILIAGYYFLFQKEKLKFYIFSSGIIVLIYFIFRNIIAHIHNAQIPIAPIAKATLIERIINIPAIILYYLKTFFFPNDLVITQFWIVKSVTLQDFFIPLIVVILFLTVINGFGYWIFTYKRKQLNTYIFFVFWFILGLSLHLQIIPLDMTVADRWFYFPIVGLIGILGIIVTNIPLKKAAVKPLGIILMVIIILSLSVRTYIRSLDWKDELTLYSHDVKLQDNFFLKNSLAAAYIEIGKYKQAKPYIESSVKIYPYMGNTNNLAIIYLSEGNIPKTKEYLQKSITHGDSNQVYQNYSNFLINYGTTEEALKFTKTAVLKYARDPELWLNLAKLEYKSGNKKAAIFAAETSYRLSPLKSTQVTLTLIKQGKLIEFVIQSPNQKN